MESVTDVLGQTLSNSLMKALQHTYD